MRSYPTCGQFLRSFFDEAGLANKTMSDPDFCDLCQNFWYVAVINVHLQRNGLCFCCLIGVISSYPLKNFTKKHHTFADFLLNYRHNGKKHDVEEIECRKEIFILFQRRVGRGNRR